ncbi:MAG: helix-turn-helix domain-containing protein [Gaiellaceae bacterium]
MCRGFDPRRPLARPPRTLVFNCENTGAAVARALRREEGLSVREIAAAVGVSRSTASLWLRDVPLTDAQRAVLIERNPGVQRGPERLSGHRSSCAGSPRQMAGGRQAPG